VDFTLDRRVILWESPLIREIGQKEKDRSPACFGPKSRVSVVSELAIPTTFFAS